MINKLGIHGQKIQTAINNNKTPDSDKELLRSALKSYKEWKTKLLKVGSSNETLEQANKTMIDLLNNYKFNLDFNIIFASTTNFLYRQKGQIKLDNTVMEEFLPIYIKKCLEISNPSLMAASNPPEIGTQTKTFSSLRFGSSLGNPGIAGTLKIKTKDQDFALSRKLFIKSSYDQNFTDTNKIEKNVLNLGYVMAELKTNLDKTMFQEASATASDVKHSISKAHYYLLCDFLDMAPISTATTDIDAVFILRKAKRIGAQKRSMFSDSKNRLINRDWYQKFLMDHPYDPSLFLHLFKNIDNQMSIKAPLIDSVLEDGFF